MSPRKRPRQAPVVGCRGGWRALPHCLEGVGVPSAALPLVADAPPPSPPSSAWHLHAAEARSPSGSRGATPRRRGPPDRSTGNRLRPGPARADPAHPADLRHGRRSRLGSGAAGGPSRPCRVSAHRRDHRSPQRHRIRRVPMNGDDRAARADRRAALGGPPGVRVVQVPALLRARRDRGPRHPLRRRPGLPRRLRGLTVRRGGWHRRGPPHRRAPPRPAAAGRGDPRRAGPRPASRRSRRLGHERAPCGGGWG